MSSSRDNQIAIVLKDSPAPSEVSSQSRSSFSHVSADGL